MLGRSIRVARISGIPIGISPLWLVMVMVITVSLGEGYYPREVAGIAPAAAYALGLASVLLLYASILAHEFGHAVIARRRGVQIEEIDLWLLGGVARMSGRPKTASDELAFASGGPAVTVVIAAAFGLLALVLPHGAPAALRALVVYQLELNLIILGFNLIPAFPLDGGRIARALLWRRSGDEARATDVAAALGRGFGYVLVLLGILSVAAGSPAGLYFAVVGIFLISAAGAERIQEQVLTLLSGASAAELMSAPVICIPAGVTLLDAGGRYFLPYGFRAFPVSDEEGRVLGILSVDQLDRRPGQALRTAAETADRDPQLLVHAGDDVAVLLTRPAFARVGRAAVVDDAGHAVGILSVTDVQRVLSDGRPRRASRAS